ncbi:uncharacterized protein LOC129773658 [Toxorhynchites rutilus septentrionalis]|uniref:uncharacterized protein LOC129773658 n=1 Tax=Toxorhynchites rutilus septentrionalis TaxID=329112 RepID=UPI002478D437|nr:uncharacterized protein LOC129773658 [Toxorhynchites rutilus septentrionalis]
MERRNKILNGSERPLEHIFSTIDGMLSGPAFVDFYNLDQASCTTLRLIAGQAPTDDRLGTFLTVAETCSLSRLSLTKTPLNCLRNNSQMLSLMEASVSLRVITINEFHVSLLLVFVDFKKAFDRLNHENIWAALRRRGVPEKLVHLIEAQYEAFSCKVLHNGVLSDPIRVTAGVRQGCILSLLLFLIVIY